MSSRRLEFLRCLLAGLLISGATAGIVQAVPPTNLDLVVTSGADSGPGSLRDALTQVNAAGAGSHSITIDSGVGSIAVGSFMPIISLASGAELTINGSGTTVDGQNQYRPFFVRNGTVTISDLSVQHGLARGGNGGDGGGGGGGGLGAGGAVFVDATASVTLKNVHFDSNASVGGNGGLGIGGTRGGGGGGGLRGNGGNSNSWGGGGGGGLSGSGGSAFSLGGGGGGGLSNGASAIISLGGAGGAPGGSGGNNLTAGQNGSPLGGGGGGGRLRAGGRGSDFGGGGGNGVGAISMSNSGGFGGGGGGNQANVNTVAGGFGGGDGGGFGMRGQGGDGLGGAVFVRQGGSLTIIDSAIANGAVTGGTGQSGGTADGSGLYLMSGVSANFSVGSGQTSVVGDSIAGDGSLTKSGTGTLKLEGTNTYAGGTDVSQGRLSVNGSLGSSVSIAAAGELGGNGTIYGDVSSDGRLAAGNSIGHLTVSGNLTQSSSSTTQVEINDGGTAPGVNNDAVHVTGTASVGGSVEVKAAPGNYTDGTKYTFLEADGGVTGTYSSITDDLAFFDAVLVYNALSVQLMLEANSTNYLAVAQTSNQRGVAAYLDAHSRGASGDLGTIFDELKFLSTAGAIGAFDQLGGQIFGTSQQLALQAGTQQFQLLSNRLRPHAFFSSGPWASSSSSARFAQSSSTANGSPVQLVSYTQGRSEPQLSFVSRSWQPAWNGWVEGYGLGGNVQSDGNAAAAGYGLGGTQFGLDRLVDRETLLGFYGGYAGSSVASDAPSQLVTQNGGRFGSYLRRSFDNDYWLWIGGMGFDDYGSSRALQFGGLSRTATGDYSGWQAASYLERGHTFRRGLTELQPLVALQYFYLRQNSFSESGAGAAGLDVAGIDTHSLRILPGARLRRTFYTPGGSVLAPELRGTWMHEFLDTSTLVTSNFAGTPGSGFAVQGTNLGRDWALLGTGLAWQPKRNLSLYGNYDLQASTRQTLHIGSGGLQYQW